MSSGEMNRRDFHRLTAAAFGGVVAGAAAGCSDAPVDEAANNTGAVGHGSAGPATDPGAAVAESEHQVAFLLEEPHVCRGLNSCMGTGAGKENACAGQGTCATAAQHSCHGANECKGQGGCGELPGQNSCKGNGECAVPLHEGAWEKARAAFEQAMQAAGKEVGSAPAKG